MKIQHSLREQLYKHGFTMSPEAKRQEVEEAIKEREQHRNKQNNKETK